MSQHFESDINHRIAVARETQGASSLFLHDPIEDDPRYAQVIKEAEVRATAFAGKPGMGRCHIIWSHMQQSLREEQSIVWFTPSEMNPRICFD